MIIVTGEKGALSIAIRDYLIHSGFPQTFCHSVRDDKLFRIDFEGIDVVVHVAGVVPKSGTKSEDFYKVNRDLTKALATAAKSKGVGLFIYISSMSVYGMQASLNPAAGTIDQQTVCTPNTDYGKSKMGAESALQNLADDKFKVAIIRVPSIYGKDKHEYFAQYELICNKFRCVPIAFKKCYRSAISITNLCELIRLIITCNASGIFCPDDGPVSASDYCAMIHPELRRSRCIGLGIELFLKRHPMVKSIFGAVYYAPELSNIFGGAYRIDK